jgi:hypothetical protein
MILQERVTRPQKVLALNVLQTRNETDLQKLTQQLSRSFT